MVGQGGVVDLLHQRMAYQVLNHLLSILCVAIQPQGQRFSPLEQQESGKGRDSGPGIPQEDCADIGDEGSLSGGLGEFNAMIAGIWLGQPWIPARRCPIEGAARPQ